MAEPMRCYRHPRRETRISCASCGRPICTECMIQTDVGIKCPDDARTPRRARAGVMKPNQIAKTLLAGVGVALIGYFVVFAIFEIRFLTFILSGVAGYGAGTLIHRAGGRNDGALAMSVSGVSVFLAFFAQPLVFGGPLFSGHLLFAIVAVIAAIIANR